MARVSPIRPSATTAIPLRVQRRRRRAARSADPRPSRRTARAPRSTSWRTSALPSSRGEGRREWRGSRIQPRTMTQLLQRVTGRPRQRVEDARSGGRGNSPADAVFDVGGAGKQRPITVMNAGQRVDDRLHRQCQAASSARTSGSTASSSPIRPSASAATPASIGRPARSADSRGRDERIADPHQRLDRRKGQEEVTRGRDRPRADRSPRRAPCLPMRFDRVKPHIDVRIVERGDQRVDRFAAALRAEGQRRLDTQIGIGVAHQRHQRVGDVDAGQRQQLRARCSRG